MFAVTTMGVILSEVARDMSPALLRQTGLSPGNLKPGLHQKAGRRDPPQLARYHFSVWPIFGGELRSFFSVDG